MGMRQSPRSYAIHGARASLRLLFVQCVEFLLQLLQLPVEFLHLGSSAGFQAFLLCVSGPSVQHVVVVVASAGQVHGLQDVQPSHILVTRAIARAEPHEAHDQIHEVLVGADDLGTLFLKPERLDLAHRLAVWGLRQA